MYYIDNIEKWKKEKQGKIVWETEKKNDIKRALENSPSSFLHQTNSFLFFFNTQIKWSLP